MGITYRDQATTDRIFEAVNQESHIIRWHCQCSFFNRKRTILDGLAGIASRRHDDWRELEVGVLLCDDLSDQYTYLHVTIFDSLLTWRLGLMVQVMERCLRVGWWGCNGSMLWWRKEKDAWRWELGSIYTNPASLPRRNSNFKVPFLARQTTRQPFFYTPWKIFGIISMRPHAEAMPLTLILHILT